MGILEKELDKEIDSIVGVYTEIISLLEEGRDRMMTDKEVLPTLFTTDNDELQKVIDDNQEYFKDWKPLYFYENMCLYISKLKERSTLTYKDTITAISDLDTEYNHYSSKIRIDVSTEGLDKLGFSKPSKDLRDDYVLAKKNMKKFKILKSRASNIESALKIVFRDLDAAEINFRRLMEVYNRKFNI